MDGEEFLDGLHFYDDSLCNQEVEPIAIVDPKALIEDRHWGLPAEGQVQATQFVRQAGLIDRLEEAWPKGPVNANRRAKDPPRHAIQLLCAPSAFSASLRFNGF